MKWLCLVAAAGLSGPLAAHPHSSVDQQVHLAVGTDHAEVTIRIIPAATEGDLTREVLDLDQDGELDSAEARVFLDTVLAALEISWNTQPITLVDPQIRAAPLERLEAGQGQIEITATLSVTAEMETIHLSMTYDGLGAEWLIQPYYFEDLQEGPLPRILRFEDSNRIELRSTH